MCVNSSWLANLVNTIVLYTGLKICFILHGMAFQLADDMLDFTGTTASLGKGALSDIRQVY